MGEVHPHETHGRFRLTRARPAEYPSSMRRQKRPTFDLLSGTWADGRPEPILAYFDSVRGTGRRPGPRKNRAAESVFPFGTGKGTGRVTFDVLAAASARNGSAGDTFLRVPAHDLAADRPGRPVLTLKAAARAVAYGSLSDPPGTGPGVV